MTEAQRRNWRKWIEALRSGKFEQGEGMLKSADYYCCLGVAREICPMPESNREVYTLDSVEASVILGLRHEEQDILAAMNDGSGNPDSDRYIEKHTFNEIADALEDVLIIEEEELSERIMSGMMKQLEELHNNGKS